MIPGLRRQRQQDPEFKTTLGYLTRPGLKGKKKSVLKNN
jgi:hypothetical protein